MKETYKISTIDLIALCHILDDFKDFNEKITSLVIYKYENYRNIVLKLQKASLGKNNIDKVTKKFYQENKHVIDNIAKYSNLFRFFYDNYEYDEKNNKIVISNNLNFFYNYLIKNKKDLNNILDVLSKITELNFTKFEFNENFDFTKDTYTTGKRLNYRVNYLDNLELVPSYISSFNDFIEYKSSNSNYNMSLGKYGDDTFSLYDRNIQLNSLLFSKDRLPNEISKEEITDKIMNLGNIDKEASSVKDSVDLSISIYDLEDLTGTIERTFEKLDNVKKKDELIKVLENIKKEILTLQSISSEYNKEISLKYPSISEAFLEKEKKLFLERRYLSSLDLD